MAEILKTRKRDAEATKARILQAAKKEFAKSGLGGARVDEIADRANANKRMIYHYFGNKEDLFRTVLEDAYLDIRRAERKLDLDRLSPKEALETLVQFTWDYYLKNPEFITLVNSENLHRAKAYQRSAQPARNEHKGLSVWSKIYSFEDKKAVTFARESMPPN